MSVIDINVVEDHERFRAELASIQPDGRRRWIFARKPQGKFTNWRIFVGVLLIAFLAAAPFVKVRGHQFLLFNIIDREFVFFGVPFWPNDFYLVAVLFLTGIVSIVLLTASIGRIWCGWLCPQTVFMEMIFRRIEWGIHGGPAEQARRKAGPWNSDRVWRTVVAIAIFFAISFMIANVFLAYVVSSDRLVQYMQDGPLPHLELFIGLVFFTFVFFMVFYRFREQACLIACPYGRYMSALVDENTIAVTYDHIRGEKRVKWDREDVTAQKSAHAIGGNTVRADGKGSCIDCHQCVTVCPTGIDIRNGIQLECVNCTACIDACNSVMSKVGLPSGLIRYTSLRSVVNKDRGSFMTNRIKAYGIVWLLLVTVVTVLFANRQDLDIVILRQEGTTWVMSTDGYMNIYRIQMINKSGSQIHYTLDVVSPKGYTIKPLGIPNTIESMQILKGRFMVKRSSVASGSSQEPLVISVSYGDDQQLLSTAFLAP
ncbi:MAG: putative electron transport protein YccM [Bacteroidota bacterium]|jgi:cytochrome c oxidase accessory protein FixG